MGNKCPDHECDTMYYSSQHHTLPGVGHPHLLSGKAVNKPGMEGPGPPRTAQVQPQCFSEITLNFDSPSPPIPTLPAFQGWGLELLKVSGRGQERRPLP